RPYGSIARWLHTCEMNGRQWPVEVRRADSIAAKTGMGEYALRRDPSQLLCGFGESLSLASTFGELGHSFLLIRRFCQFRFEGRSRLASTCANPPHGRTERLFYRCSKI